MNRKNAFKIGFVLLLIPFIIGFLVYKDMPDMMPSHFNLEGVPDEYKPKVFVLFGLPGIILGIYIFSYVITNLDPRRKYQGEKAMSAVLLIIPIISIVTTVLSIFSVQGKKADVNFWLPMIMFIMFIFIGNYLPKTKRNYTVGIKLPWTLDSDYVWDKTHKFGGKVLVIGGIIGLVTSLLGGPGIIQMVLLFVVILIPIFYSFYVYKTM